MKWQILFFGKNKKNSISMLSAEIGHMVVKVKGTSNLNYFCTEQSHIQFLLNKTHATRQSV